MADLSQLTPIEEYSLSVNNFNEPEVFEKQKALMLLLTRLILLEPGTFQSHPDMGVGLISNYRYRVDDGSLSSDLKARIQTQIDTYLPFLSGIDVVVMIKDKSFYVIITIDTLVYGMLYNTIDNTVYTDYTTIAEL